MLLSRVFDGKGGGDQCLARKYRIRLKYALVNPSSYQISNVFSLLSKQQVLSSFVVVVSSGINSHLVFIFCRGVDAPEIGQPYGEEAKVKLCDLVKDRRLLIHVYGKDRYGRTLGDVYDRNGTFIQVQFMLHLLSCLYEIAFWEKKKGGEECEQLGY